MKIVLSSQGNTKEDLVDVKFGRCKYFAVYDSEVESFSFVENSGKDSNQGAGTLAAQVVLELNADVLLTERLGPKAFKVLNASHLNLFKCQGMTLIDAVNRFETETLDSIVKPFGD